MTSPLEQKIKITGPVVVTANRVGDGAVVYRRADGGWTTRLRRRGRDQQCRDRRANSLLPRLPTICARSVPISRRSSSRADGGVRPGNLRELIRLGGPTIDLPVTFGI